MIQADLKELDVLPSQLTEKPAIKTMVPVMANFIRIRVIAFQKVILICFHGRSLRTQKG